jgi:hypothetical protein
MRPVWLGGKFGIGSFNRTGLGPRSSLWEWVIVYPWHRRPHRFGHVWSHFSELVARRWVARLMSVQLVSKLDGVGQPVSDALMPHIESSVW